MCAGVQAYCTRAKDDYEKQYLLTKLVHNNIRAHYVNYAA